jgi:hypothetical protein
MHVFSSYSYLHVGYKTRLRNHCMTHILDGMVLLYAINNNNGKNDNDNDNNDNNTEHYSKRTYTTIQTIQNDTN